MKKELISALLLATLIFGNAFAAFAGGPFESYDITNAAPSPIPGHILAKVIGIKWDARSIPVQYSINTTQNPVPNPLGAAFLSVADAKTAIQASLNQWNNIPTSYIDLQITKTTSNPGLVGFDMVNEISFRTSGGFTAIASSPSTNLISDVTLVDGDQIDNDADADVSSAITVATDVDGDGDIEFPAGFYKAGTILDNDVQYNTKVSNGLRFTIGAANADAVTRSVDLNTVSTHEFGHSLGLAHAMGNQTSKSDGSGVTMFPFIDTGDPVDELAQATVSQDDISWASYIYQEGSANSGPAKLQTGDVAFNKAYGLIRGTVNHGVLNQPIAGASVFATDWTTGDFVASAYSGTTQLSFNPVNGGLFFVPTVADAIPNGDFVIPVPKGNYAVGIEAVDGTPVPAANISFTTQIGNFFGQQNFVEEYWNNNSENSIERRIGQKKNIPVVVGKTTGGVDITTSNIFNLSGFGARTNIGFINPPAGGFIYAMQFPATQIAAVNPGQLLWIQAVAYDSNVLDASVAPVFAKATLTTGTINPDGTANINLLTPLESSTGFLGQDNDFAMFYIKNPHDIGEIVRAGIADGTISNLFVTIEIMPAPFAGVSGQPPLVGLSTQAPILGRSFLSTNGGTTFTRRNDFNFRFSLVLSQPTVPGS